MQEQTPSIILIDYNLVPEPGIVLLKQLKSNERYSSIPIVILTESPIWDDHAECYRNGASTVVKKPATGKLTKEKIETFFHYWIHVAETR